MAKIKKAYFCKECGFEAPKWLGHCPSCGAWNSFTEEVIARENASPVTALTGNRPRSKPQRVREIEQSEQRRFDLSCTEVNRVLGGGLIRGSMILLGGEPGIGKSTLSLQIALRANGLKTLYVSGEESPQQIKMRAERLGVGNDECYIYSETNMENILRQIDEQAPDLIAGAAGVALCLGADFVKVNPPKATDGQTSAEGLKIASTAAGRTGLVCAGGSKEDASVFLSDLYDQIHIGGACGNATGRNIHMRSTEEAVRLTKAISAITLGDYSVEDALAVFNGEKDFTI